LFNSDWVEAQDDILSENKTIYDSETGEMVSTIAKVNTPVIYKDGEYNPILVSYFLAHNILAESYNRLMYGDFWSHPNKAKDKNNDTESLSSRWIAQTKRLVIAGATYHSYAQGLKYGVDEEINIAVVEDNKTSVHNSNGDEDQGLDAMDGSGFVSPYYSMQANHSLIDAFAGKNKKTIFHDINSKYGNARLLKWAEYSLSNSKRRESFRSLVSAENLFKKCHNKQFDLPAKQRIVDNFKYTPNTITYYDSSRDVYIKISSANFYLDGENLKLRLTTNDSDNIFIEKTVNSIYDLDQAFGGC
jgi:hypothetical protein